MDDHLALRLEAESLVEGRDVVEVRLRDTRLEAEDLEGGLRNVPEPVLDVPVSYTHLTLPTSDLV